MVEHEAFAGDGPRAEALMRHRARVIDLVRAYGGRDVHVFGSVARGTDTEGSDIDLVYLEDRPVSLLASLTLHRTLGELLECSVDLFAARELTPRTLDLIAADAVPL
ncbi:nucleotidyltransferase domain-containing protein [Nocardioides panacisoli]|uniref:nucleotidyltransferase family protein n=1 Tax=Nocardioides panacisoli TaxID=627624 RepID=UPI0031DBA332